MTASIDLAAASTVVDATLAHGRDIDCAPLTVAVLDAGGHLVACKREDRSGIMRVEIAVAKAWGALGLRLPSRGIQGLNEKLPHLIRSFEEVSDGRMVPVPGGVLIRDGHDVIGAAGVSGDVSERDEECALRGIEAAGLEADNSSTHPW